MTYVYMYIITIVLNRIRYYYVSNCIYLLLILFFYYYYVTTGFSVCCDRFAHIVQFDPVEKRLREKCAVCIVSVNAATVSGFYLFDRVPFPNRWLSEADFVWKTTFFTWVSKVGQVCIQLLEAFNDVQCFFILGVTFYHAIVCRVL